MKSHPILFSAPMVRSILDGSKTQTRRIVKPQPVADERFVGGHYICLKKGRQTSVDAPYISRECPYGQTGDQLWVRETWRHIDGGVMCDSSGCVIDAFEPETLYRADAPNRSGPWKPSIFMPRWASRITLEIVSVRVERLQDISEADALAEGSRVLTLANPPTYESAKDVYQILWDQINGPGSWAANPWVWCVEFKRIDQ